MAARDVVTVVTSAPTLGPLDGTIILGLATCPHPLEPAQESPRTT